VALPSWVLSVLACPACRLPLPATGTCRCGRHWGLDAEVPDLLGMDSPLGAAYDVMADSSECRGREEPERFTDIDRALLDVARGRTLDLGCGPGRMLGALESRCQEVLGVDLSRECLARARRKGHAVLRADALRLPFRDWSFHTVVAGFGTFAHLPLAPAAAEASRVLVPGGHLAFHNFGREALRGAALLAGLVRLRRPRSTGAFHSDPLGSWRDVEAALAGAGLQVLDAEGRLHVPGLARLTDRRIRVRARSLLPWSWDVVVVARKET